MKTIKIIIICLVCSYLFMFAEFSTVTAMAANKRFVEKEGFFHWRTYNKGLYDTKNFQFVIEPVYSDVYILKNELVKVYKGYNKQGLYDLKKKKLILQPIYKNIKVTEDGVIEVKSKNYSGKKGLYDLKKRVLTIKPIYKNIKILNNGMVEVTTSSYKKGLYDIKKSKYIFNPAGNKNIRILNNELVQVFVIDDEKNSRKSGLYDLKSKKYIIKPVYRSIRLLNNELIKVYKSYNEKGLYDLKSKRFILQPVYEDIKILNNDLIKIVKDYNKEGLYDLKSKKFILKPTYSNIKVLSNRIFNNRMLVIKSYTYNSGKMGLYDLKSRSLILSPDYNYIKILKGEMIRVEKDSFNKGLYDIKRKKLIINPIYDNIEILENNLVKLEDVSTYSLYDKRKNLFIINSVNKDFYVKNDNLIFEVKFEDKIKKVNLPFDNYQEIKNLKGLDFIKIKKADKYGLYDLNKKNLVLKHLYDNIERLNKDYVKVKKTGKYGLYNLDKDNLILSHLYENIESFSKNYLKLKKEKKYGLYDLDKKNLILNHLYEDIEKLNENYVKLKKDDKYGLFNLDKDKLVLNHLYEDIEELNDNYVKLKKEGKYGLYDLHREELVINHVYDRIANTDKTNIEVKKITSGLVVVDDILYNNFGFQINLDVITNKIKNTSIMLLTLLTLSIFGILSLTWVKKYTPLIEFIISIILSFYIKYNKQTLLKFLLPLNSLGAVCNHKVLYLGYEEKEEQIPAISKYTNFLYFNSNFLSSDKLTLCWEYSLKNKSTIRDERSEYLYNRYNELTKKRYGYNYNEFEQISNLGQMLPTKTHENIAGLMLPAIGACADNFQNSDILLSVLGDSQNYSHYVRQGAYLGLKKLLKNTDLGEYASTIEDFLDMYNQDQKNRVYEIRILPKNTVVDTAIEFKKAMDYFNNENLNDNPKLYKIVKQFYKTLPASIDFLTHYPLKLISLADYHNILGYYKEKKYSISLWTRFTPPKDVGTVHYRSIAVDDLTVPNSIGIAHELLEDPVLFLPVEYHEYLHACGTNHKMGQGIKNEAEVWLRENIFLRSLIAQMAPKKQKEFSSYHSEIINKFKRMGMFQTVELINTDPITDDFRLMLNMIIESLYGKQKTAGEASIIADQEISYWDYLIESENQKLTWCPHQQYPYLSSSPSGKKVREIIIRTETQKNTLKGEEFEQIINESEIKRQLDKWNKYISQIPGFKYNSISGENTRLIHF